MDGFAQLNLNVFVDLMMTLARSRHGGRGHRGRGASHCSAGRRLLLQHGPVEGVVVLVVQRTEKDPASLLLTEY